MIAVGIELVLGLNHLDGFFGQMCLVEAGLGISAILLLDWIHTKKFSVYPKTFKRLHKNTIVRFGITFGVIVAIQYIFQIVPLVSSTLMALGIVFCAPIEEYFFRGLLMEPVFRWGSKSKNKITIWKYNPKKKKPDKEISYVEIGGILLSSSIFAAVHVNYYSQPNLILMVWFGGIWLAFVYFWNRDLTPLILSHFLLNIIFTYQFFLIYV